MIAELDIEEAYDPKNEGVVHVRLLFLLAQSRENVLSFVAYRRFLDVRYPTPLKGNLLMILKWCQTM